MKKSELSEIISRFPIPEIRDSDSDTDEEYDYADTRDFEVKEANDIYNDACGRYAGEEENSCHISPFQATLVSAMFLQYAIENSEGSDIGKNEVVDVVKKLAEINGVEFDQPLSPDPIEEGMYLN